jgi:hypothetical protein
MHEDDSEEWGDLVRFGGIFGLTRIAMMLDNPIPTCRHLMHGGLQRDHKQDGARMRSPYPIRDELGCLTFFGEENLRTNLMRVF